MVDWGMLMKMFFMAIFAEYFLGGDKSLHCLIICYASRHIYIYANHNYSPLRSLTV